MPSKLQSFLTLAISRSEDLIDGCIRRCINIGCGSDIKPFWTNCDSEPVSERVRSFNLTLPDDLNWLCAQEADLIVCNHVVGYINLGHAVRFFDAAHSGLREGGRLIIEFPDLKKISSYILALDLDSPAYEEMYIEAVRALYAYDVEDAYDCRFNKQTYIFGWSADFLAKQLAGCGFARRDIGDPRTHGMRSHRDSRIVAWK